MNDSIRLQGGGDEQIESFQPKSDGTIEVVVILTSRISTWPSTPKTAKKRIYKAEDGEIILDEEIEGKVIPQKTIPEKIEWEE